MSTMGTYLPKGMEIKDDDGSVLCRVSRDVQCGESLGLGDFEDWSRPISIGDERWPHELVGIFIHSISMRRLNS